MLKFIIVIICLLALKPAILHIRKRSLNIITVSLKIYTIKYK